MAYVERILIPDIDSFVAVNLEYCPCDFKLLKPSHKLEGKLEFSHGENLFFPSAYIACMRVNNFKSQNQLFHRSSDVSVFTHQIVIYISHFLINPKICGFYSLSSTKTTILPPSPLHSHTDSTCVILLYTPIMSHLSNTFCSFSCVLEITDPPSTSRRISFDIATCMDCTVYSEDAPILSRQDLILIYVNYFNASNSDFPVGSLVFCQGILTVLESMSNGPVLSVHATSLLR